MEKSLNFKFMGQNIKSSQNTQSLTLAYIGDSIYDIMAREYMIINHIGKINDLHKRVSSVVSAKAQASFMKSLLDNNILTEVETAIYNRAKNQKNNI